MQHMLNTPNTERRINVRYEDLITSGHEEVERLSEWAGVTMTSVERWRSELSDEVQNIFSKELGQELSNLGYAV